MKNRLERIKLIKATFSPQLINALRQIKLNNLHQWNLLTQLKYFDNFNYSQPISTFEAHERFKAKLPPKINPSMQYPLEYVLISNDIVTVLVQPNYGYQRRLVIDGNQLNALNSAVGDFFNEQDLNQLFKDYHLRNTFVIPKDQLNLIDQYF